MRYSLCAAYAVTIYFLAALAAQAQPAEITSFLSRVRAQCGSVQVISTFRRGARIAGTHRRSCHATGQAVDYTTSNPSCALRVASGSRLGHSIDYGRVRHFHVSTCAQERGARFAHGGGQVRYARANSRRHHGRIRLASLRPHVRRGR